MRRVSRAEAKTKNEIMRCVERYIAREIYHAVREPAEEPTNSLPDIGASGVERGARTGVPHPRLHRLNVKN